MALQDILLVAGIVFLVAAIGLGIVTFIVFRRENIPAVLADLSGKTRQLGIDGQSGAAVSSNAGRKASSEKGFRLPKSRKASSGETDGFDPDAPTGVLSGFGFNPDAQTDVAAEPDALTEVSSAYRAVKVNAIAGDDSPTSVFIEGDDSPTFISGTYGDDSATEVIASIPELPSTVYAASEAAGYDEDIDSRTTVIPMGFAITRSELRINSDVVIKLERTTDEAR